MPGPDMLIGVNMAKIAANARMAEANGIIHDIANERDAIAHERNAAILENRRLAAKVREIEERMAARVCDLELQVKERLFKQRLEESRARELVAAVRNLDPTSPLAQPSAREESHRRTAQRLCSAGSHFEGFVYDVDCGELRRV